MQTHSLTSATRIAGSGQPIQLRPETGRVLRSGIPMAALAAGCVWLGTQGFTMGWIGAALFGLGTVTALSGLLPAYSHIRLTDAGLEYRHGSHRAAFSWSDLARCEVISFGERRSRSHVVRLTWRSSSGSADDDGLAMIELDGSYGDAEQVSEVIAAWARAHADRRGSAPPTEQQPSAPDVDFEVEDVRPPGPRPLLTWALLAAITAVTLWEFVTFGPAPDVPELARAGGASTGALLAGQWWKFLTANLLHGNPLHLIMNLFVIALLARELERMLGRVVLFAGVAAACVGSSIGSLALDTAGVTIGASGIGFALMGMAFLHDPRGRTAVGRAALQLLPVNVVITFVAPSISIGGHVGGLVSGLLVAGICAPMGRIHSRAVTVPVAVGTAALCAVVAGAPAIDVAGVNRVQRAVGAPLVERLLEGQLSTPAGERMTLRDVRCRPRQSDGVQLLSWSCTAVSAGARSAWNVRFDEQTNQLSAGTGS